MAIDIKGATCYRISYQALCFALYVRDGVVIDAAPVARWAIGKPWASVESYWLKRGAEVLLIR
jgi:hypothetical protein